jgi:hypothetical protein
MTVERYIKGMMNAFVIIYVNYKWERSSKNVFIPKEWSKEPIEWGL